MKKIAYILVLLSISITAQQTQWQKTFGGSHADYLYDAIPTLDYGFIMVGGSLSNNTGDVKKSQGDYDFFITKISEYGKLDWSRTIGGNKTDIIKCIVNTYDGGYLIAGISNSDSGEQKTSKNIGMQDIWILKIDILGNIEWQKTLGSMASENIYDAIKTKDGYLIAGTSTGENDDYEKEFTENKDIILQKGKNKGNDDFWLVKIDLSGNEVWQKSFGGKYKDVLKKVIELPNGELLLAGNSNSPLGNGKNTQNLGLTDWWLIKTDKNGNEIWQKSFGQESDDQLTTAIITKDKNILLGGNFKNLTKNGTGNSDFILKKIDQDGNIIWENNYSQGKNDVLTDIIQNKDSTFLLSGYTSTQKKYSDKKIRPKNGSEDYLVLKLDKFGNELWRKIIGTNKKEVLKRTIETRDGGYVLIGANMPIIPKGKNDANFYIVKLLDKDKTKPKKLPLEAIPNPTRDYTQIVLGNDYKNGEVLVLDYTGKILQHFKISGKRIIPINLTPYADGTYIIQVKTNIETNSAKVIKINQ